MNLAKPDVEIFELAAKRLGLSPDECVFVDDVQEYLDGADIAGMKTILYEDFTSFKADMDSTLTGAV